MDNNPKAYKLAGPVPHRDDPDVKAIANTAWEGKMIVRFEQGLVLRIEATNPTREWYATFYETNDNHHKLHEMSGEGMFFGRGDLEAVVDYLAHRGMRQLRPAAPLPA